ncbi:hypothetical protein L218DRAFT_954035 [Marasmius fiardii PR-910]|nr:hypothetical protein L218DRAFT_954035 [Marasmius fiardii PR-910]
MKINSVDKARESLRKLYFDSATDATTFSAWQEREGIDNGQWQRRMAENMIMMNSCATIWDGFLECADVIHSDWEFDPKHLTKNITSVR